MTGRLQGKRAFITGAGQGMGRATALAFAAEGAEVIAASRTREKMADLPDKHASIEPLGLDVSDGSALEAAVQSAGRIDILFNCAAYVHDGTILDCGAEEWQRTLDHNITPIYHAVQAVLPGMLERGTGSIINVASVASSITGVPRRAAYGMSKAAVIGLTKGVARDIIRSGVRCNALCPGTTESPSLVERMRATGDEDKARAEFTARQPMGRLGTVEEMAQAAIYLGSDESAFMSGQLLVLDGGQTL